MFCQYRTNNNIFLILFILQVETCNRFMSLTSKLVACKNLAFSAKPQFSATTEECPKSRIDFYQTFSSLIKMGNAEKQGDVSNCRRQVTFLYNYICMDTAFNEICTSLICSYMLFPKWELHGNNTVCNISKKHDIDSNLFLTKQWCYKMIMTDTNKFTFVTNILLSGCRHL